MAAKRSISIKFPVSDDALIALAHRYGLKRATERDLRVWAEGTLQATMEQVVSERFEYEQRTAEKAELKR
jgi:hypothetical protein